jgi:hypothetical protein
LVFEDAHARHADLLQYVIRLELLAAEAILVGQEQGAERGPGMHRIEEAHQAWPPVELGAGDRVVDVDVLR